MFRKVFSVCLVLVIAAGAFTMFQASDAQAGKPDIIVVPAPRGPLGGCPNSFTTSNGLVCYLVGITQDDCVYKCGFNV